MREYGKVYTAFWTSTDARGLSDDGRMLALYLMTCPHGNMLGCFRLSDAYAADDMQWKPERIRKGFEELFDKGFAYRCSTSFYVLIRHYLKWNQFENPNVSTAAGKMFSTLGAPYPVKATLALLLREFGSKFPDKIIPLLDAFETNAEPFDNPFGLSAKTRTKPEPKPEPQPGAGAGNNIVELKLDCDVIQTIFSYWQKTMESPRAVLDDKRKKVIAAALKNYAPRDVCEAILGCSRSDFHMAREQYAGNNKQNGLGLILRDAEHIDKFIVMAREERRTVPRATNGGQVDMQAHNLAVVEEMMRKERGNASE